MGQLFEDRNLRNRIYVFKDRREAGRLLAHRLSPSISPDALVLAVPAGGVPVALEIARKLNLPLDLMIVRKIQIPGNTEAGFGAVGPDGEVIFNQDLLKRLRLTEEEIDEAVQKTKRIMEARNRTFREGRIFPEVNDKTAILVDDGLASGFTMIEAARFLQRRKARKIIIAVPTAPEETVKRLLPMVDEIYVLNIRASFPFAVAEAYENWYDLGDEEVLSLLKEAGIGNSNLKK
jgi:predicted phosphoribosyltransferase